MIERLKRLAWFIFKSPQRTQIGFSTLFTDLRGLLFQLPRIMGLGVCRGKIAVCIGIYNRSEMLLGVLLPSLLKADRDGHKFTLSVADCGSTDMAELEAEIRKLWKGQLVFSNVPEKFTRSRCFNRAVRQSDEERILICDADMELPQNLFDSVGRYTGTYSVWFPVCRFMLGPKPETTWKWMSAGTGICAMYRRQFVRMGGLNEAITDWGGEDWDLFFRCYRYGIMPLRTREKSLVHHYHPSLKPGDFKPIF